jgi:hypothetical protein
MVLGLRVSDTPPLVEKKLSNLTTLSTMWIVMTLGILSNGRLCRVARHRSFTTRILRSISGNRLNQGLERREFAVGVHRFDVETTLEIILIHLFESLEYLRYRVIREMIDCFEADLTTECQEERNLVGKEDVCC